MGQRSYLEYWSLLLHNNSAKISAQRSVRANRSSWTIITSPIKVAVGYEQMQWGVPLGEDLQLAYIRH